MRALLIMLLLGSGILATSHSAFSQNKKSEEPLKTGIVYGYDHTFAITAPDGWVLDNQAGVPDGLHAVFYPIGESWPNASAVMYTSVASKEKEHRSFEQIIDDDVAGFREASGNGIAREIGKEKTADGAPVRIWYFENSRQGRIEQVAFIEESKVVVMLSYSASSQKAYEKTSSALKELLKSYRFLTDKVLIDKKPKDPTEK